VTLPFCFMFGIGEGSTSRVLGLDPSLTPTNGRFFKHSFDAFFFPPLLYIMIITMLSSFFHFVFARFDELYSDCHKRTRNHIF
jgi:hypothetical protein